MAESFFDLMQEKLTPTDEDLEKELTQEQLKELCLRSSCCVHMDRWNPVHDYVRKFRDEKRLENKSVKRINKLLAKAVNRYKNTHCYTDEEIGEYRRLSWAHRKKLNLLYLELWEYDKQKNETLNNNINNFISDNIDNSKNTSDVDITNSERTEHMPLSNNINNIISHNIHSSKNTSEVDITNNERTEHMPLSNNINNIISNDIHSSKDTSEVDITNSERIENMPLNNNINSIISHNIHSSKNTSEVDITNSERTEHMPLAMLINTESLVLNSENLLESEDIGLRSCEVFPTSQPDYSDFNRLISLNSTQNCS